MTVLPALPQRNQWDALILATDIDTNMVATGQAGLYDARQNRTGSGRTAPPLRHACGRGT